MVICQQWVDLCRPDERFYVNSSPTANKWLTYSMKQGAQREHPNWLTGLSFIERPMLISRLNLKLVQISWKAPLPPKKVSTLVRSCDVNFSRHIFMHDWTHFMHHWNPWSNWWYLKVGQKKPPLPPLRGHFLTFHATLDQVAGKAPLPPGSYGKTRVTQFRFIFSYTFGTTEVLSVWIYAKKNDSWKLGRKAPTSPAGLNEEFYA